MLFCLAITGPLSLAGISRKRKLEEGLTAGEHSFRLLREVKLRLYNITDSQLADFLVPKETLLVAD